MKISLDHQKSQELSEIIHTHTEHGDWDVGTYHLSDGLYCPVSPYCRMTGVDYKVNRRLAALWTIGKVAHVILEENFDNQEEEYVLTDHRLKHPCYAHLDVVYLKEPIEFKSTRITIRTYKDIPERWIKQIAYECVFADSNIGWLATINLVDAIITVWKIIFTTQEVCDYRVEYIGIMERIQNAVEDKNPYTLKPIRKECLDCIYVEKCLRRPGI